jgi:branched-chain amino acid transport system substrate-binding protein
MDRYEQEQWSKWRLRLVGLALVVLVLGAGLSAATASAKRDGLPAEITLNEIASLTGAAGWAGQTEAQGASLAVREANRQHFLGKTKIGLKVLDDQGTPATAVAVAHQFIDGHPPLIIGPTVGGEANVVIPLTIQAGIPTLITTATAADVSDPNIFRVGIPQPRYTAQVLRLLKGRGVKKVAVFYDSGSASIVPVWQKTTKVALAALKLEVVDTEAAPVRSSGLSDFTTQVANMLRSKPDAIGIFLDGAPNLTVVNQLRQAGFKGDIWGQSGMEAPFFIGGGPNVNGVLIPVSFAAGIGSKASLDFTKRFEQKYPGSVPTEISAHGYDAAWMAMRALKAANSTNPAAVREALTKIKSMPSATGVLRFNEIGDAVGKGFVAVIRDGKLYGVTK